MNKNILFLAIVGALFFFPVKNCFGEVELPPVDSSKWTEKYDDYFRKYSKRFFGVGFDYKWFKAQAIAESKLRKDAKSWVGAKGLMQIMPRTFAEIKKKNPAFKHVLEPRWNIAAGIYYDKKMFQFWKSDRSFLDRMRFAFASYNAGAQNVLKGQKLCNKNKKKDCNLWKGIEPFAPKVKSWRHKETLHYIKEIFKLMEKRMAQEY
jgi:soluble lytic murein transglycosylase-like protein